MEQQKVWLVDLWLTLFKEQQHQPQKLIQKELLQLMLLMTSPTEKSLSAETWSAECPELRPFTAQQLSQVLPLPITKELLNQLLTNKN